MIYLRLAPPWGLVLGAASTAGIVFGLATWAGHSFLGWTLLRAAMAGLGVATAVWIDDLAAETVAAAPRSLSWQRLRRAVVVLVPFVVASLGIAAWTARVPSAPFGALVLQAIGIMVLAMATALLVRRFGHATPGETAGLAVAAAVIAVAVFNPSPETVPVFPQGDALWGESSALWICVIVCAITMLVVDTARPFGRRSVS